MTVEHTLVRFITELDLAKVPQSAVKTVKHLITATLGSAIAGVAEDGCPELRELLLGQGGNPEATVLIYGDRLPARSAAMLNGTICRALDFCDAMAPGLHIGSALVPAAFAAAQLRGGCTGREFLTALIAGAELGARFNLTEAEYNGFDPTGVAGVFAATAGAGRILRLTPAEMQNALALAFNRCGGSFQSNVDGSLAVRLIQGWVAETGILCATLAKAGLTGPSNFVSGIYGFAHLFGRDRARADPFGRDLGSEYRLTDMVFKKYPSCGVTQGATHLALAALTQLQSGMGDVEHIEVRMPPYAYRLVGHSFKIGSNPRVDAQFNVQYCVASALVRGASRLRHFSPDAVRDTKVGQVASAIHVISDAGMNKRGHSSVDLTIRTARGQSIELCLDRVPGFPDNPLSSQDHRERLLDCVDYAGGSAKTLAVSRQLEEWVAQIESSDDATSILEVLADSEINEALDAHSRRAII